MHPALTTGFAAGLGLIVAIGAQNAFVLRQGLVRRHRLALVAFCATADALLIVAGVAGLGRLLTARPALADALRLGGAAFLAAYALLAAGRAWRGGALSDGRAETLPLGPTLLTCAGLTFLNPHVYLDTVVLLGGLANGHGDAGRWFFALGAALASIAWFSALAYGASALAPVLRTRRAWRVLDAGIALLMAVLAGLLLGDA